MTQQLSDEIANRFTLAAAELLRHPLDPAFAQDAPSTVFLAGRPLTPATLAQVSLMAVDSDMDLVHLAFDEGRERFGPTDISIFCIRFGAVFRWIGCALWAPRDGGPMMIMPPGVNVCFAQDGKALISFPTRPTRALGAGMKRARQRLHRAAGAMTHEQLETVTYASLATWA
ncbi:hypothetical protein ACFSC3_17035 [Sphingomonas floccifaciens]|uniref:AraC family transcriptional regulator n=1 Tax=Sphingomonas floccifaciens TaxID=1844115 RepID=A0ABW4NHM2_9SPHN